MLGLKLVQETTKKIKPIWSKLLTAQSKQNIYADKRRRELELEVGEFVILKVSSTRDVTRYLTLVHLLYCSLHYWHISMYHDSYLFICQLVYITLSYLTILILV